MDEELQRHARSFGPVADAYDRGRPTYPADAVGHAGMMEQAVPVPYGAPLALATLRVSSRRGPRFTPPATLSADTFRPATSAPVRQIGQGRAQGAPSARQQALQRLDADLHQGRGLDVPQFLIVAQHDRLALARRQGLK